MPFDPTRYGVDVEAILSLDGRGERLMPLALGMCSSKSALSRLQASRADALFAGARSPEAAMSGLYLYFSCLDESHEISQGIHSTEGSYWHGIMHRQEPDAGNAGYWFRRVGTHPIFDELRERAAEIASRHVQAQVDASAHWDPLRFIDLCEEARKAPGSELEKAALEIQRAEWQLLFDYCARGESGPR